MSTFSKTLSKVLAFGGVAALATSALAQTYSTTSSSGDAAAGGAALIFIFAFYCCLGVFALAAYGFNIWMFIDLMQRNEVEMPNRTTWMVLLIVGFFVGFGWIAAIVYYFTEKKKLDGPKVVK